MKKVVVLIAGVASTAAAGAALARRRQAHRDADALWREATADASAQPATSGT